ncbi:hypothetical protein GGR53DRAFT_506084 [Hypoxylon sp. FL1150]|nr:hypothetical protein GGR53DRAFT_506084 [Hypoxylon sp. FL1150]
MGNTLSSIIDSITDHSDDEKVIKDTLQALYEVGLSRTQSVIAEATSVQNTVYVPFSKVLFQKQQILCNTSTNADDIVDGIKDAVSNLIQGQILDGVTDIIRHGLKVVLGSSFGQISSEHTYAIIATELGALMRIDTDVYNFQTTSVTLTKTAKNVTAITAVISSVDCSKLTASDIRALVSLTYSASSVEKQTDILNLVIAAWKEDRQGNLDSTGLGLSGDALERFRSHFVPSVYERKSSVPRKLQPQSGSLAIRKKPGLSVQGPIQESFSGHINERRDHRLPPRVSADRDKISILISLCRPVDGEWIENIGNRIRELVQGLEDQILYDGFVDATNGEVITYQYKILDPDWFESYRKWSRDVMALFLANLGNYVYPVKSLHLQYKSGPVLGSSAIKYDNPVKNETDDTIIFHAPYPHREWLEILPGQTLSLEFKALYIVNLEDESRWVTYDTAPPTPRATVAVRAITLPGEQNDGFDFGYEMTWNGQQNPIRYNTEFSFFSMYDPIIPSAKKNSI